MFSRRTLLTATIALFVATAAPAMQPMTFVPDGVAIRGYDPVAYFTESRPVIGSAEFSAEWNDATWHFASAENREMFLSGPEHYAPQYGGYCSWGVSRGYLVPTIPEAWGIYEDRLYLNANLRALELWNGNIPANKAKADANWPTLF